LRAHDIVRIEAHTTRADGPHSHQKMKRLRAVALLLWAVSAPAWADQQQDPQLGKLLQQALAAGACFDDKFDEQVWLATMEPKLRKFVKDDRERADILHHVHCEARRLQLPPGLIMAVIDVESRFDRWAVSSAGAVGLMQVMPFWPRQLGMTNHELVRIPQNLRMGCTILKFYLDLERGDYTKALARYNGSVGRRNYADLVLTRLADRWQYR
jgi:soluble lytic murein transglycosylase-like protein